ncbi:MAG: PaaI family thioesterase [Saccharofermentans sp.]|nr:PaaI family thioesterase [Saccharofermentans sp.]
MNPDEAREFFKTDRYANDTTEIEILEISEGYAKTRLAIKDKHLNGNNVVMGGCIYTLADYTFGIASNCGPMSCVTLSSNIVYNAPGKGKYLYAETKVIKTGKTISNYRVDVTDDNGKVIANADFLGYRAER